MARNNSRIGRRSRRRLKSATWDFERNTTHKPGETEEQRKRKEAWSREPIDRDFRFFGAPWETFEQRRHRETWDE